MQNKKQIYTASEKYNNALHKLLNTDTLIQECDATGVE